MKVVLRSLLLVTFVCLDSSSFGAEDLVVKGTLVDASCLKKEGAAAVLSAEHISCAKECFEKGQPLGVFSEDLGLIKIVGELPAKNHAMLLSLLGKAVEVRGPQARGGDYSTLINARSIQAAAK